MEKNWGDKRLAFGMMRLPLTDANDKGSVDLEQVKVMVDRYLEAGFSYFDTAYRYCGGMSERAVKTCVTDRHPRENYRVVSKLPSSSLQAAEDRDGVFSDQLHKTGAGYFDIYLLHNVSESTVDRFLEFDCFTWIREKLNALAIRHAGMSFHGTPELLEKLLSDYDFIEYVQLQLNWLDWDSPTVRARECYETVLRHGRKVLVMEPVKGGVLAVLPEQIEARFRASEPDMSMASWGIRFAASLPGVEMVLSGMSNTAQMEDNLRTMSDFRPLTEEQMRMCFDAAREIREAIPIACTGCDYCVNKCPQSIPSSGYFDLINRMARENRREPNRRLREEFAKLAAAAPRPSDCMGCGVCETVCPQHLDIRMFLNRVSELFEA